MLNVSPELTELSAVPAAERDVVSLRGAFTDPGTDDRHVIQINWGDGSPRQVVGVAGGTFDVPHRYADEGSYTVTVDLVDDRESVRRTTTAEVRNAVPSGIVVRPTRDVSEGAVVSYDIVFVDPGERDAHTVTVDWGDGGPEQTIPVGAGRRHVEVAASLRGRRRLRRARRRRRRRRRPR